MSAVVAYVDGLGYLRCVRCMPRPAPGARAVHADNVHATEPCDTCGVAPMRPPYAAQLYTAAEGGGVMVYERSPIPGLPDAIVAWRRGEAAALDAARECLAKMGGTTFKAALGAVGAVARPPVAGCDGCADLLVCPRHGGAP